MSKLMSENFSAFIHGRTKICFTTTPVRPSVFTAANLHPEKETSLAMLWGLRYHFHRLWRNPETMRENEKLPLWYTETEAPIPADSEA